MSSANEENKNISTNTNGEEPTPNTTPSQPTVAVSTSSSSSSSSSSGGGQGIEWDYVILSVPYFFKEVPGVPEPVMFPLHNDEIEDALKKELGNGSLPMWRAFEHYDLALQRVFFITLKEIYETYIKPNTQGQEEIIGTFSVTYEPNEEAYEYAYGENANPLLALILKSRTLPQKTYPLETVKEFFLTSPS